MSSSVCAAATRLTPRFLQPYHYRAERAGSAEAFKRAPPYLLCPCAHPGCASTQRSPPRTKAVPCLLQDAITRLVHRASSSGQPSDLEPPQLLQPPQEPEAIIEDVLYHWAIAEAYLHHPHLQECMRCAPCPACWLLHVNASRKWVLTRLGPPPPPADDSISPGLICPDACSDSISQGIVWAQAISAFVGKGITQTLETWLDLERRSCFRVCTPLCKPTWII